MPPRQHTGASLAFLILMIWLLMPMGDMGGQTGPLLSVIAGRRLARHRAALEALNGTQWGDFAPNAPEASSFVNITGFREVDGLAWEDLDRFRDKSLQLSRHAVASSAPTGESPSLWDTADGEPVWTTASGNLEGDWVYRPGSVSRSYASYNLSNSVPEIDWIGDRVGWGRNMTGSAGRMHLHLEGNKTTTVYEQLPRDSASSLPLSGGLIRSVRGALSVEDTAGSQSTWEMRLWGVHWPRQGVVLMTTTSEKFEGIFGLPHLTPGPDFFQSSKALLTQRLNKVLEAKENNVYSDQTVPWSSEAQSHPQFLLSPAPQCEYVLYAQVHPPDRDRLSAGDGVVDNLEATRLIAAIEEELASPQGAPIGHVPALRMSAVVYSPDCAFFLESKGPPEYPPGEANHLTGVKAEVQTHLVRAWLLVFACLVFGQVYLLKNQMRETCTPSTMGRVSFGTVGAMVMVDGITFTAAATWVSSARASFLPTLALMFAAFLSMTIGGSFLAKIYEVQFPENNPRPEASSANNTNANTNTNTAMPSPAPSAANLPSSVSLLPGPVTATGRVGGIIPPSQPVFVPFDGDVEADVTDGASALPIRTAASPAATTPPRPNFQAIIGRFILISLVFSFVTLSSPTWYPSARAVYLDLCALAYLSLWLPQIRRNALRNCRRALAWPFVLGQSLLRAAPLAYFWLWPGNFLFARTSPRSFAALAAWLWLQLVVLAAQDVLGPRFAVPAGWLPAAWDYHPVLREDNLEAGGLPIGLLAVDDEAGPAPDGSARRRRSSSAAAATAGEKAKRAGGSSARHVIDCSICQEILEVPVVRAGGDEDGSGSGVGVANVFARRMYMVTPCRHIFHTACLESWMKFRLQCPICREDLPPL
ncbi:Zinc finger, RING/FYVE/PHD-type [Cordyceps fumosorosea ARSEF 2679]|uniref:DSC E3 ubiquitin ligase complex subunit A n=1 Tax=Cordyceps fumosorosea (strain ARSEF 2679) TaxID=1081104 RepID=A0A167YAM5_CORFA|nr:Zinc finger, RING/FYVE/PHD-type [Cordyceps fumosorosea ARSEF 2679]OAA66073.1 Zinc finger, RING/FYVE/PHD-type [Cordyceps fumosorosea ARSEF 2679]